MKASCKTKIGELYMCINYSSDLYRIYLNGNKTNEYYFDDDDSDVPTTDEFILIIERLFENLNGGELIICACRALQGGRLMERISINKNVVEYLDITNDITIIL